MANIDKELKAIMDAVYGEEVRGSIHDALKAGNDEINRYGLQESARVAAEQARAQAESARATAENAREAAELLRQQGETSRQQTTQAAVTAAENAATAANEAADRANAVADEDISDKQVQFTEAAEKSEIESGDTLGTICGKVKKSLAEMDGEIAKVNGDIGDVGNLTTTGQTNIIDAINFIWQKVGGFSTRIYAYATNLDTPPQAFILQTSSNPTGYPSGLGGNSCMVIQHGPAANTFSAQLAFCYGSDKMAIRRKTNNPTWSSWKYITFS